MTGWLALSVLNAVGLILILRQVHQLTNLQQQLQSTITREATERVADFNVRLIRLEQTLAHIEHETLVSQRLVAMDRLWETRTPMIPRHLRGVRGDEILADLLKDLSEDQHPKPLTSFERVLKDDPEDPV